MVAITGLVKEISQGDEIKMIVLYFIFALISFYICYRCYETMQVALFLFGFYSCVAWLVAVTNEVVQYYR